MRARNSSPVTRPSEILIFCRGLEKLSRDPPANEEFLIQVWVADSCLALPIYVRVVVCATGKLLFPSSPSRPGVSYCVLPMTMLAMEAAMASAMRARASPDVFSSFSSVLFFFFFSLLTLDRMRILLAVLLFFALVSVCTGCGIGCRWENRPRGWRTCSCGDGCVKVCSLDGSECGRWSCQAESGFQELSNFVAAGPKPN